MRQPKETKVMQDLENYDKLNDQDKYMLPYDLEALQIPAGQLDLNDAHVRALIVRVVLADYRGESDGGAVGELAMLAAEPKLKLDGGHQVTIGAGADDLVLTIREAKILKELLNRLDLDNIRQEVEHGVWNTIKNLNK